MKLSQLDLSLFGELRRDGEFTMLGKATTTFEPHHRVLTYLTEARYVAPLSQNPNIVAAIIDAALIDSIEVPAHWGILVDADPKKAFIRIHNALADQDFYWQRFPNQIDPSAVISPQAFIADHSVKIGARVLIEPHATIHSGTIIGDDCVIRSGTRIGSNGFEFSRDGDTMIQVKCAGRAILEHHVEVQHNCCVDRGIYGGDTVLREYSKYDNLVHIAHDCDIGARSSITGGSIIAGRTILGTDVWIGPNVTLSNGLTIGDGATVSIGSVVTRDVAPGQTVTGNFAIDHAKFLAFLKSIR
jgi:UDP-3-O-[3-hydroxymyristoyl] glucosamine N-acyltransferase